MANIDLLDNIVRSLAEALISDPGFKSLCRAGLKRKGRSTVLEHITQALITFARHAPKQRAGAVQKAAVWMMYECRTSIALKVCELVSPEELSLDRLLLSLGQDDELMHNQDRFLDFVKRRFRVSEQFVNGGVRLLKPREEDDELEKTVDIGERSDELPDLDVFAKGNEYKNFVCTGPAFQAMHKKLRSTLFPPPSRAIDKILRKYLLKYPYDTELKSIACVVDWHVLEYVQEERIGLDDLHSIFTLNGDLECAGAARFAEYLRSQWQTGRDTLNLVKILLGMFATGDAAKFSEGSLSATSTNTELQLFPKTATSREQAYVKISGSMDEIQEKLEQMAWLTATLRPRVEGQLTVSCIDFQSTPTTSISSSEPEIFQLSLVNQDQIFRPAETASGQCWTSIASESILAYGFTALGKNRPTEALGVEAPFDILASFAGIRYPVLIKERIVFASSVCVLIPERKEDEDAIQWHLNKSDKWIDDMIPKRIESWDPRLETIDISSLVNSRAFLGYCRYSEELLGTAEFEHVDIAESDVPQVSKISFHCTEKLFRIYADAQGRATSHDETKWRFNKGETALIRGSNQDPDERLRQSAHNPVLLYDQGSLTAFLVSELGMVMHLITTHLREESEMKRQMIPLARVNADGGEAAYTAILESRDLTVSFADSPQRRYIDIVETFLDVLEQRKFQQQLARAKYRSSTVSSNRILGWDHADLKSLKHEIRERELESDPLKLPPTWWQLFRGTETLVIFTKLSKAPIRKAELRTQQDAYDCQAWDEIPRGKHLLVANVMRLQALRSKTRKDPRRFATRYMLGDNVAWARPMVSRLFEHDCKDGGSCCPLQDMIVLDSGEESQETNLTGWQGRSRYRHHPGAMVPSGAVIFASEPIHFEKRPCWRKPQTPMLHPSEWNVPYLVVSMLIIVLAWWNIQFVLAVLVLVGAAYALK